MKQLIRTGLIAVFAVTGWAAGAAVSAAPALACNLPPASTGPCPPDTITVSPSATLVDSRSSTITTNQSGLTLTVSYVENVYRNPSNSLCPNCLTWVLQVSNDPSSTETIARVTVSDFTNWQTDIGVTPSAPGYSDPTGQSPTSVSRSANGPGEVVAWCFESNCAGNGIAPGQKTVLLAIDTNSTAVTPGTVTVQNGITDTGPGLSPAIPEAFWVPALGLFGGAIAGGYAVRRRRTTDKAHS